MGHTDVATGRGALVCVQSSPTYPLSRRQCLEVGDLAPVKRDKIYNER